jgi:antagonist of KipI
MPTNLSGKSSVVLPVFEVLNGGLQSTIQDLGRPGFLATGMPPSGPADRFSLAIANLLVGNDPGDRYLVGHRVGDAGIEMLLFGLQVRALADAVIAVTGGGTESRLNGLSMPRWQAIRVYPGDIVSFERGVPIGARAYLAVAGGFDAPHFGGSRATNIRAGVGGLGGRALRPGDILHALEPSRILEDLTGRSLRPEIIASQLDRRIVRVVLGPQEYLFTDKAVETFLTFDWQLSPISDRMGCRYVGPKLEFRTRPDYLVEQAGADPSNIVDDTIPVGGIQVPGGLEPIVLHVDGPSLGGYAKIATVISADLRRVGQTLPGEISDFKAISTSEGVAALSELENLISEDAIVVA